MYSISTDIICQEIDVNDQSSIVVFSQRLREIREKHGLIQQELAKLCDLNILQIGRYERGEQEPSLSIAKKLAEVLGVSVDYLVGLSDDPHGQVSESALSHYESEILATYRRDGWLGVARLSVEALGKR